ncbi:hypothetical protein A4H97_11340 [Niastella yeongjuensis]|uniref:GLPGLI family protein n=1 Tax=Niastella yeongjuensis TaxID=354355 RepID=A0A1V9E9J2_9BACT|nr:GLPGLI family protein [Niastella yeongjuensis]OQP42752.1 hypothetical protein A4H97_11340 [Niastella yeongjuensis]SEO52455.1 GLPGLI family protein [Niastella yeongjuensis]
MKRTHLFFALLITLFTALSATAQEGEPVQVTVTYQFIHINDTNHRENPIKENLSLCVGEHSSKYTNAINEVYLWKSVQAKRMMPTVPPEKRYVAKGTPPAFVYGPGYTYDCLFQYQKDKKLYKVAQVGAIYYLIESPLPKINWKLDKETRTIGDYTCQKAVGDFAGRTYTAWFTTALPFRSGPWKLNGLPGLILEASDSRNEVSFLYKTISKDTAYRDTELIYKDDLVKAGEKAYEHAFDTYLNDPMGVVIAQRPDVQKVRLAFIDSTGKLVADEKAQVKLEQYRKERNANYNNPLELKKQ